MTQALITSTITVITGTLVYVLGKIFENFFIEPIRQQKETIGKISEHLIYAARLYSNPYDTSQFGVQGNMNEWTNASDKTRELSALLNAKTHSIPFYNFFFRIKLLNISKANIMSATTELIGLSNSYVYHSRARDSNLALRNSERVDRIKAALKINA